MSGFTERFSEGYALLDVINPISTSTAINGTWTQVGKFNRLIAKLQVGLIAAGGTLDFKIEQATNGAGAGAKPLKSITQLADTADNVQRWIEVKDEELDVNGGFDYVRITITGATAASLVSAELLGFIGRYEPVAQPATLVVTT